MGLISKKLGKRIKEIREKCGFTQAGLAEILNMEPTNLSKIERGIQMPKEESLIKISKALDVSVCELFDYEHFSDKSVLIQKITNILETADEKSLRKFYKILMDIK